MSKRKVGEGYEPPLSAFAAARRHVLSHNIATVDETQHGQSAATFSTPNGDASRELNLPPEGNGHGKELLHDTEPGKVLSEVFALATVKGSDDSEVSLASHLRIEEQESTDQENSGLPSELPPPRQLSTFRPGTETVLRDDAEALHVRLKPGESLVVLGQYDLKVRKGTISLLGAILTAESPIHRVYSSSTQSIPPIRCVFSSKEGYETAEVELAACKSGIRSLKNISPHFGRIWNEKAKGTEASKGSSLDSRSFAVLYNTGDDDSYKGVRQLEVPKRWQALIERVVAADGQMPAVVLICGPKSSGKSTFSRLLANATLTADRSGDPPARPGHQQSVAFLDLDPGQPEFSPPSQVSLLLLQHPVLGPPYTHPIVHGETAKSEKSDDRLIKAHAIASTSPRENPYHFEACAADLVSQYRRHLRGHPMVINYSSWLTAEGLEVLEDLIRLISPSDIVYLSPEDEPTIVVDKIRRAAHAGTSLHTLSAQPTRRQARTPAELRAMQELSYFHQASPKNGQLQWDSRPLTRMNPWSVTYGGDRPDITSILILGHRVPPQHLHRVVDGSILAVVVLHHETEVCDPSIPPEPSASSCIGHAYVRGMDVQQRRLELITPIPQSKIGLIKHMDQRIVLVGGKKDVPSWAYLEEAAKQARTASKKGRDESGQQRVTVGNIPWIQFLGNGNGNGDQKATDD